jgi:hypothetical protein
MAGHAMPPPPPGNAFTGSHFQTWAHIMPGLANVPKGGPNVIPAFTAPAMPPPMAAAPPAAGAGAPGPAGPGQFFPANSTSPEMPADASASTTLSAVAEASSAAATSETSAASETTTAAAASSTAQAGLPAAEAGAGDAEASATSATSSAATSSEEAVSPPEVTAAAQNAAVETTIDVNSLTMSNYGVLGIGKRMNKEERRRRYVVPSGGFN